jgi:hypothetical protein
MKSIKKQIAYIFLCSVLSLFISPQLGAQDIPQEVTKAAWEGLPVFLDVISQKNVTEESSLIPPTPDSGGPSLKMMHGFEENDSLDQAYPGYPFKLYLLTNESILNYTRGSDVSAVLSQTNEWYFPVMIGENTKTILKVAKMKNSWQAVGIGMAEIAVELGKIRKQWPPEQGYAPLLAVCDEASCYLFTVPQYDSKNLTVITHWAKEEESKDYSKLEDSGDFIEGLKSRIEEREKS